jgi:hypothetical protein
MARYRNHRACDVSLGNTIITQRGGGYLVDRIQRFRNEWE